MKKRILALLLSATVLCGTAIFSAAAAPKAPKIKEITASKNYKSATVKWNKVKSAKGYQIKYGYKKSLKGAKTKNVAKSKTKITLKKLKAGKTLFVKIRAKYKAGKKTKYTKFSAVKEVKLAAPAIVVPSATMAPAPTAPIVAPTAPIVAPTMAPAVPTTKAPTTKAPTTAAPTKPTVENGTSYTMEQLQDSLRVLGRTAWLYGNLNADFTNSGYEVGMECEGNIKVKFKATGGVGMLGVIIDEDFANMHYIKFGANDVSAVVPTNLQRGYHKIRVVKLNECDWQTNSMAFRGLEVNGTPSTKPAEKDLKIEVYGDSITCGYGILSPGRSSDGTPFGYYQDGMNTYAALAAQKLDADINFVSRSGIGLEHGYGSRDNVMSTLWDRALPKLDATAAWDFNAYTPDIVIINLGTNDTSMISQGQLNTTQESIKASATTLLTNIRTKYPDCKIVWLEGMMGGYASHYSAGVKEAVGAFDDAFYCNTMPGGNNGLDWHPNKAEHKTASTTLYNYLVNNVID